MYNEFVYIVVCTIYMYIPPLDQNQCLLDDGIAVVAGVCGGVVAIFNITTTRASLERFDANLFHCLQSSYGRYKADPICCIIFQSWRPESVHRIVACLKTRRDVRHRSTMALPPSKRPPHSVEVRQFVYVLQ